MLIYFSRFRQNCHFRPSLDGTSQATFGTFHLTTIMLVFQDQNSARLLPNEIKLGEILNTKFVFADEITFKAKLNAYNIQKPPSTTVQPETTPTEDTNDTTTVETETTTPSVITTSEELGTVEVLTETSTTEDATTELVTSTEENATEEVATEVPQKKETEAVVGEVLFQDVEEPSKKNQPQFDYKLKGV